VIGSTLVDDEAVLHYCCHRCVGDGVLLLLPRAACMKWVDTVCRPSSYDSSSQVALKDDDDEGVVGVVGVLTSWQWLAGYLIVKPTVVSWSYCIVGRHEAGSG
jgi:hypothetical protein